MRTFRHLLRVRDLPRESFNDLLAFLEPLRLAADPDKASENGVADAER